MMQAVPQPMLHIDAHGMIISANGAAQAMLGDWITYRSYAAVLRQPMILAAVDRAQKHGRVETGDFTPTDQSGQMRYRVHISPIGPKQGGLCPVLMHFTDITPLQDAQDIRRDFVANVSHELKTPLTAVLGFIETLRGPARDDAAARDQFLNVMQDEAHRMNRLVSDLLSLSRVEITERQRPSEQVDLHDVVCAVAASLGPQAKAGRNSIEVAYHRDHPDHDFCIAGDRDQLMQVFLNLTENALKYGGPDKPVRLVLRHDTAIGPMKGPVVRVDVVDQGEGIDSLHLPRLTERFYRIDTHRSREMGGTGLGLAIVKHIVNRHRGRLNVESKIGFGSCFSVLIPKT
jgi:two-component system phosphate regulon sensor histidine kinase PhoR